MRKWLYIVVLLVMSMVVLPATAWAQLDAAAISRAQRNGQNVNLGGNFGADNEEGGNKKDSTKINRIRRPLESYYSCIAQFPVDGGSRYE